jgi:hypothetical protein
VGVWDRLFDAMNRFQCVWNQELEWPFVLVYNGSESLEFRYDFVEWWIEQLYAGIAGIASVM